MAYTQALDEVDLELSCVYLRWRNTNKPGHGAVSEDKLNAKANLNNGKRITVEPFKAIHGVEHVVKGKCVIPPLSRALL